MLLLIFVDLMFYEQFDDNSVPAIMFLQCDRPVIFVIITSKIMFPHTGKCRAARFLSWLTSSYLFVFKTPRNFSLPCCSHVLPGVFLQVLCLISVRYGLLNFNFIQNFFLRSSIYIFQLFIWVLANICVIMLYIIFLNWDSCTVFSVAL